MSGSPTPRASGRIFALLALAFLVIGIGLAMRQWRVVAPPPAPAGALSPGDSARAIAAADSGPADSLIHRALASGAPDSAAIKSRWIDPVPGVELADLAPAKRELFVRFANAERCTCGCGYTLAGCRASDMSCEVSGVRIAGLLDSVRAGRVRSARGIRSRPAGE